LAAAELQVFVHCVNQFFPARVGLRRRFDGNHKNCLARFEMRLQEKPLFAKCRRRHQGQRPAAAAVYKG
jgi:hypothetical protein